MRSVAPWNLANPVMNIPVGDQMKLIEQAREVLVDAPLVRPRTPNNMPMRVRVSAAGRLGWVGDGAYRYSPTQRDGRPWPAMPKAWSDLASYVAQADLPWDSTIINWYDEGAALGWHRDASEVDTTLPIVTVSLGDSCSWAVRDWSGGVHRARLDSGDITLLRGETRSLEHTVERIIAVPLFSPLQPTRGRLSITIRVAGAPHA